MDVNRRLQDNIRKYFVTELKKIKQTISDCSSIKLENFQLIGCSVSLFCFFAVQYNLFAW